MNEDIKMFHISLWMLGAVAMLTVALQVCYRTQDRARARVRSQIVQTQQEIAARQANFASYVRPEILRNLVVAISPKSEVISFQKSVQIGDLKMRGVRE